MSSDNCKIRKRVCHPFFIVHRGEVDVQPDQLQSFLSTAELLKIKGLADQNLCGGDGGDTSGTLSSSAAATGDSRKALTASQSPIIKVPVPPKRPAPNNFTRQVKVLERIGEKSNSIDKHCFSFFKTSSWQ